MKQFVEMGLTIQTIEGTQRTCVPDINETIKDDIDIDRLAEHLSSVNYYHRQEQKCWVIDLHAKMPPHPVIYYMKISDEMPEAQLIAWLVPLKKLLKLKST